MKRQPGKSWRQLALAGLLLVTELLIISVFFRRNDIGGLVVMASSTLAYLFFISSRGQSAMGRFDYKLALINVLLIAACLFGGAAMEPAIKSVADALLYLVAGTYLGLATRNRRSFRQILTGLFVPQLLFWLPTLFFFSDMEFKPLVTAPWLSIPLIYWIGHSKVKWMPAIASVLILSLGLNTAYASYLAALSGTTYAAPRIPQADYRANLGLIGKDGRKFRLAALKNKVIVLDMWATSCGYCYAGFPKFQQLANEYASDSNIVFASLNIPLDKEAGSLKAFELIAKYDFRQFISDDSSGSNKWGVATFPRVLIFDKALHLRYNGQNNTEKSELINNVPALIEKLLQE